MGWFDRFAKKTSVAAGAPAAFAGAVVIIAAWLVSGPMFHFSDTWQLVINTGTTIVTFLMVFLIQATQNRDTSAIQSKLDEIIRAIPTAHNAMIDLEGLDEKELSRIHAAYEKLASEARAALRRRMPENTEEPEHVLERAPKGDAPG